MARLLDYYNLTDYINLFNKSHFLHISKNYNDITRYELTIGSASPIIDKILPATLICFNKIITFDEFKKNLDDCPNYDTDYRYGNLDEKVNKHNEELNSKQLLPINEYFRHCGVYEQNITNSVDDFNKTQGITNWKELIPHMYQGLENSERIAKLIDIDKEFANEFFEQFKSINNNIRFNLEYIITDTETRHYNSFIWTRTVLNLLNCLDSERASNTSLHYTDTRLKSNFINESYEKITNYFKKFGVNYLLSSDDLKEMLLFKEDPSVENALKVVKGIEKIKERKFQEFESKIKGFFTDNVIDINFLNNLNNYYQKYKQTKLSRKEIKTQLEEIINDFPEFNNTTIAIYKGSVEIKTNLIRLYAILENQDKIIDELINSGSKNALNFKQEKELQEYPDFDYESKMCLELLFEKYKYGSWVDDEEDWSQGGDYTSVLTINDQEDLINRLRKLNELNPLIKEKTPAFIEKLKNQLIKRDNKSEKEISKVFDKIKIF